MGVRRDPMAFRWNFLNVQLAQSVTLSIPCFILQWRTGRVPTEWKDGIIVTQREGKKSDCSNYRPITLPSVPGKVFAHVLLGRIQSTVV